MLILLFSACSTSFVLTVSFCESNITGVFVQMCLLFQVTLNVRPNQDLAILNEVRQTNTRTKRVQDELMALKAKIYGLENELRFS